MRNRSLLAGLVVVLLIAMVAPGVLASPDTPQAAVSVGQGRTECSEDLSGRTVTYYHFGDLSGIFAFITQPLLAGTNDAIAYFNENGGLCGATIAVDYRDTAGDTDRTQQYWDEFTSLEGEAKPELIFLYSSADGELLRDQAEELQIPILLSAGSELALFGENADTPGWEFALIPLYTDQLGLLCEYIGANWDQFGIEGDPVIGHLSWLGAFGQSTDTEKTRAYCETQGVGYAGAESFLPTASSVSDQLTRLVDQGANIIFTTSLASGPALVAQAVSAAELQGQVLVAGTNWALDTSVIGLGGADTANMVGNLPYLWWDQVDHPGVQLVLNSWLTNRLAPAGEDPEAQQQALATRNIAYLLSWATIDLWIEIMTQTINRVGYDNITGADIYETLNGGFEYSALDGVLNVAFDAETRAVRSSRIGQIQFVETPEGGVAPAVLPLSEFAEAPDLRASVDLGGEDTGEDEASEDDTSEDDTGEEATEEASDG
ncbi:MAG: ABC transporter substrate-binding protein [Chloroflexi bacterium]|nr:ABC transporter substrate-binding protein [Chloroflexota bacterium]